MGYEREAYVFTNRQDYAAIYCRQCADEQWCEAIQAVTDSNYFDDSHAIAELRELAGERAPRCIEENELSKNGERCEQCGEQLAEPRITCDGCGETAWQSDRFSDTVEVEEITHDNNGDPHLPWCNHCEDENRHPAAVTILEDDGRMYKVKFIPNYVGHYNRDEHFTHVPIPVYAAGCRRFTLWYALNHWGPKHYTHAQHPAYFPEGYPADRIYAAIMLHAMENGVEYCD